MSEPFTSPDDLRIDTLVELITPADVDLDTLVQPMFDTFVTIEPWHHVNS